MKRVFFHVQHLLGIGHLKRAALVCGALAEAGFEVTLASGGASVPGVVPGNVRLVQLPPLSAADVTFKRLVDEGGQTIDDAWKAKRAAALMRAWRDLIAVRTHYLLARDRTANNVGRMLLGLDPQSRN